MVLGLILFLLAFLPRVFGLSQFVTPDENLWVGRAVDFMQAISQGDWAGTFQVGHPGVTTRWTAALGMIVRYLPNVAWRDNQLVLGPWPLSEIALHMMDVLAATRLPTVLLFSGLVVAVYFLARRLVGNETAFLGAVLLALDPFCLGLSRVIHHDALSTIFMTASVLTFAHWLTGSKWKWVVLSGLLGGLAVLSKSTALFLGPTVSLMALVYYLTRRPSFPWKQFIFGLLCWGIIVLGIFALLWPAMWVDPIGTVQGVIDKAIGYAASPHERDNFFMGQLRPDPGPAFYPVATLFRLTPVTLIGLALSLIALWRGFRAAPKDSEAPARMSTPEQLGSETDSAEATPERSERAWWLAAFWVFAILFTAFMTLGAKKFDRYLMPIFPFLDLLAAAGLVEGASWAIDWVDRRRSTGQAARAIPGKAGLFVVVAGLVVILQGWSSLPAYPYYLTAYNPLLGGIQQAAHVLLIGWGEGYDQVAAYLNTKPDADKLNVATWYAKQTMDYLFKGHSWDIRANRQEPIGIFPWTQADYVVVYINQTQRDIPDARTLAFFRSLTPEYTAQLAGLDYAWVYRVPPTIPRDVSPYQNPVTQDFGGKIRLLGYDVDEGLTESEGKQYLVITFYWQGVKAPAEDYRVHLTLVDEAGRVWAEQDSYPIWDGFMTSQWKPGTIIRDVHGIVIKPDTPAGSYRVKADWSAPRSQQTLAPAGGPFGTGPVTIPAQSASGS